VRRRLVSVVAAALVVAAPTAAATRTGGLAGHVTKGPLTPVCRVGVPCNGPAANVSMVFLRRGAQAGHTTTDHAGKYRLALAPGLYTVRFAAGMRSSPTTARVPAGRFGHLNFSIDTGIR
jgi:hypothetical protein